MTFDNASVEGVVVTVSPDKLKLFIDPFIDGQTLEVLSLIRCASEQACVI